MNGKTPRHRNTEPQPQPAGTTEAGATVKAASLKSLIRLFAMDSQLTQLALGDTWHPGAGFVDESVLGPSPTVKTVIEHPYEFIGLVHFQCSVEGLSITYLDQEETPDQLLPMLFSVTGDSKSVKRFRARLARAQFDSESVVMSDE